jgi:flagella basal body P-ring formation protein FlgA
MMHALVVLLMLAVLPTGAWAQGLVAIRPVATIDDPAIRLGDLFEGAGPRAGQTLGAAPAPGRRLVLEAAQLMSIAQTFGLAWRPLSVNDKVVVERAGRPVTRADVDAALLTELVRLGGSRSTEIELGAWTPPMVPPTAPVELGIEAMSLEGASGRFSATLVVAAEGIPTQRWRLAGRAARTVPVTIANHRLALGYFVGPGDVKEVRLRAERVRPGAAERAEQVVGRQLRRPIGAELPFQLADLAPPELVSKNGRVTLVLETPGLSLTAMGRALEGAARGASVTVMNLGSQQVVEGEVIGPGRVRVLAGSVPVLR